jgi:TRAP-type uncharacterized transport system fused permease subunit
VETYRKINTRVCLALALAFSAFELYTVGFGILSPFAQRATMLAFASVMVFLLYPLWDWPRNEDLGGGKRLAAILWDSSFIAGALIACLFLIIDEDGLADRSGAETALDLSMAVVGPIVLIEMVRRVAGIPLFLVTISVVVYTYWGDLVLVLLGVALVIELVRRFLGPRAAMGLAAAVLLSLLMPEVRVLLDHTAYPFQGENHDRMAAYLWLTSEGTLGTIAAIMSEFIFMRLLKKSLFRLPVTEAVYSRGASPA